MKPTILNLFIVALGLVSLFACQKRKKDVVLHVHVQDAETKEPLVGHRWILFSTRTASGGEKVTDEWTGTVDENGDGYIDIKLPLNRTNNLIVESLEDQCYINTQAYYPASVKDEVEDTYLFELAACGQLGLELKNVNCQGEEDELYFHMKPDYEEYPPFGNLNHPYRGCYESIVDPISRPYGLYKVYWKVVRNGVTNEYDSTYYLEKGGNQTFVLEY